MLCANQNSNGLIELSRRDYGQVRVAWLVYKETYLGKEELGETRGATRGR